MHIRCGSTAYCYLPRKRPDTYGHKKTLGRAPVSPDIAGPCPAEPFQLVPTQLGLISAGIDQLRACESPPKRGLLATPTTLRYRPEMLHNPNFDRIAELQNPTLQIVAMAAAPHQATGENENIPGWSEGLVSR